MLKGRVFIVLLFIICVGSLHAQNSTEKAKDLLLKGDFEKSAKLYAANLSKLSAESDAYQHNAYGLAESYRLSGNYAQADSIHSTLDFTKVSYMGYALTLLQQYRYDKCLQFAKAQLDINPNDKELLRIIYSCNQNKKKLEEHRISVSHKPLIDPKTKKSYVVPGFIIGDISTEEALARLPEYVYKKREYEENSYTPYPIWISGINLKYRDMKNTQLYNDFKLGYHISNKYFENVYQPDYLKLYKAYEEAMYMNDPEKIGKDTIKSPGGSSVLPLLDLQEIVKHICISPDQKYIVFSSNKLNGEGGYDLFIIEKTNQGWSAPKNLGAAVNTEGNETHPFISIHNNLYFSSDGREGFGGYDIYSLALSDLKNPEIANLEKPVNSAFDDFAFVYHEQTGYGYFSSNRPNGIVSGNIFLIENKVQICEAKVEFERYPENKIRCTNAVFCADVDCMSLLDSLPKGTIWEWDMGDGKKEKGLKFKHCYTKDDTYTIRLYIYDPKTRNKEATNVYRIVKPTKTDHLYYVKNTTNQMVELSVENSFCSSCEEEMIFWDFGDGNFGCGTTVKHIYQSYGSYKLRVLKKYKKNGEPTLLYCSDYIRIEEKKSSQTE